MNCAGERSGIARNIRNTFVSIESMESTKLNTKVSNDLSIIADAFPYNYEVYDLLEIMVSSTNSFFKSTGSKRRK